MNRLIIVFAAICFMAVMAWGADRSTGLVPSEGFVEVTGGKVWYRIVGSGSRTPLLVLHGGPGVPSVYLKPLEALADDRPVIFYDQLGSGNSPSPTDTTLWTIERFVEEIAQVREALGLKEIHLYGHSWGTMIAVDYMLTKPAGIRSLVLASPCLSVPRWIHDADSLLGTLPDSLQEVVRHHERENTTDTTEYQSAVMVYYEQFLARRQPWSDDLNSALEQMNQAMYSYMWGPSEFTTTGTLSDYDRTDRLGEITIPTLLTAGQFDEAAPATVEYYQSLIPGAEFALLKNCAHLTMHDDPIADIRIIREFLAKVESK
ncbi:MAG: proline iminopeptidase-family hydrolase [candidate division Zixibacteria bacterium]